MMKSNEAQKSEKELGNLIIRLDEIEAKLAKIEEFLHLIEIIEEETNEIQK